MDRIVVDGSYGEGGGQIIRTSVSLSALTGKPVEIVNVRAKRSKPGLQAQHLTAVRAAASICAATLEGALAGSTRFVFQPQSPVCAGNYRFDIGTAGATSLVAQTLLVPLAHQQEPSRVIVTGGTHVPHAPTFDYLASVYVPILSRAGLSAEFLSPRAGFFPKGGGQIDLAVTGGSIPFTLDLTERGNLVELTATIVTSNLPDHVAERGAQTIEKFMKSVGRKVALNIQRLPALDSGAAVCLTARCENGAAGFTGLGERGKPMEKVATEPCEEFMTWWKTNAACDEHLTDQLALPMSLAYGKSCWTTPVVTEHTRTVLWLIEKFLPIEAQITEEPGKPAFISLQTAR